MIRIYSDDKIISLTSAAIPHKAGQSVICTQVSSSAEMALAYKELAHQAELKEICFFNTDVDSLLGWFSGIFQIVEAAGGLVKNSKGEYLFILRNGKWDLPKGKIDKGEDTESAALREVEEECGIKGLSLRKKLLVTYHIYQLAGNKILKPTHWFLMDCTDNNLPKPQTEEGITEVRWLAPRDLKLVTANTYASILEVLKHIRD
jgi:8-oxo-dGTP pyrophosphatase MutT (NUDIX family)